MGDSSDLVLSIVLFSVLLGVLFDVGFVVFPWVFVCSVVIFSPLHFGFCHLLDDFDL